MKKVRFSSNKADLQYYISPKKTFPEFEKKQPNPLQCLLQHLCPSNLACTLFSGHF